MLDLYTKIYVASTKKRIAKEVKKQENNFKKFVETKHKVLVTIDSKAYAISDCEAQNFPDNTNYLIMLRATEVI